MSLHNDWTELTQQERMPAQNKAFWDAYFAAETENYKKILEAAEAPYSGTLAQLAETFGMEQPVFTGFLDGINTSLKQALELDALEPESTLSLEVDFEKLYFNMLGAKAEWLYTLPQWDAILSEERRREITKEFRASKTYFREETVGRNDPCPCGSGKKYKKCCGK